MTTSGERVPQRRYMKGNIMKKPNRLFVLDLQKFAEDQPPAKQPDPEKKADKKPSVDDNMAEVIKKLMDENKKLKGDKQKAEDYNKTLLNDVLDGGVGDNKKAPEKKSIEELREELYGKSRKEMTNLEYISKTLDLRDQLMEKGETDPFVPQGRKANATITDYQSADNVANLLKDCVKAADNDPNAFNEQLRKRGLDDIPHL